MKRQNLNLINRLYKRRAVGSQEKRSRQDSEARPPELIDTTEDRLTLVQPQCLAPYEPCPGYFPTPMLFPVFAHASA